MDNQNHQRIMANNNFSNATFRENTSIQSEDVKQSVTNNAQHDELYDRLFEEISKLSDGEEIEDAKEHLEKLNQARNAGNLERAKKIFGWLPDALKVTAAGIELAHLLGL